MPVPASAEGPGSPCVAASSSNISCYHGMNVTSIPGSVTNVCLCYAINAYPFPSLFFPASTSQSNCTAAYCNSTFPGVGFARATYNKTAEFVSAVNTQAVSIGTSTSNYYGTITISQVTMATGQVAPLVGVCFTQSYTCTAQYLPGPCAPFLIGSTVTIYGTFADFPVPGTGSSCRDTVTGLNMMRPQGTSSVPSSVGAGGTIGGVWAYYNSFTTCNTNLCNTPRAPSSASHVIKPVAALFLAAGLITFL